MTKPTPKDSCRTSVLSASADGNSHSLPRFHFAAAILDCNRTKTVSDYAKKQYAPVVHQSMHGSLGEAGLGLRLSSRNQNDQVGVDQQGVVTAPEVQVAAGQES